MQIVCSGKVSRLHDLLVIRRKTFAIVQQFETPYNRKKKFTGKPSRLEANPRKLRKFSTVNDLYYTVVYESLVIFVDKKMNKIHEIQTP